MSYSGKKNQFLQVPFLPNFQVFLLSLSLPSFSFFSSIHQPIDNRRNMVWILTGHDHKMLFSSSTVEEIASFALFSYMHAKSRENLWLT